MQLSLLGALLAVLCWDGALAQLKVRTEVDRDFLSYGNPVKYRNYAFEPFVPSPIFGWEVARYDRLGQYVMQGRVSLSADEQRPGLSRIDGLQFQQLYEVAAQFNVAMLRDSYLGTNYALLIILGNDRGRMEPVKTQFSPLTLNMTRYAGVRFDANGPKNKTSLIFSKGAGSRNRFSFFTMGREERSPVILWGGHWESAVGSALKLGSTFVNQHILDAQGKKGSIFKGDVPYDMAPPEWITVRVVDDSPADLSSAAVAYDMAVLVKGVDEEGNVVTLTSAADLAGEGVEWLPTLEPVVEGRRLGEYWEAVGDEEVISFVFTMPAGFQPTEADFVAQVGGDYRIQVRQQHPHTFFDTRLNRESTRIHQWPSPPRRTAYEQASFSTGRSLRYPVDFKFPEQEPAYTVVRSAAESKDLEAHQVRFHYGIPTAQTLASIDVDLDYAGVQLNGEMALNVQNFKFPVSQGRRHKKTPTAYYLTARRKFHLGPRLAPEWGLEFYRIPADYSGNYDSRRGGAIFFTGVPVSPPNSPITQEFDLFDDNDDRDQWPDEFPDDTGLSEVNDAGIFPGLDENGDSLPDTDQNSNGVPDWDEPFLFFWSDPPEFIYDIDMNNNGLPDLTENDDEPDYPYRRDQKGFHSFVNFAQHFPYVEKFGLGFYDARQFADGGKSTARYFRFEVGHASKELGHIRLKGDVKQVKDSINDPSYIWKTTTDLFANQNVVQNLQTFSLIDVVPPQADPLLMRNSTVSTLFFDSELQAQERLQVRLRYKWLYNQQHEDEFADGSRQQDKTLSRVNLSSRLEYLYPLGAQIDLYARAKHLYWYDVGFADEVQRHWSTYGLLFEGNLKLTERTTFVVGQEGLPWILPIHHDDFGQKGEDFDRWTSVYLLRTISDYTGWKIATEMGLQVQKLDRGHSDFKTRTFFVEMFFGW